jgi:hypothetical protein
MNREGSARIPLHPSWMPFQMMFWYNYNFLGIIYRQGFSRNTFRWFLRAIVSFERFKFQLANG